MKWRSWIRSVCRVIMGIDLVGFQRIHRWSPSLGHA
jgi:hypothetical protein